MDDGPGHGRRARTWTTGPDMDDGPGHGRRARTWTTGPDMDDGPGHGRRARTWPTGPAVVAGPVGGVLLPAGARAGASAADAALVAGGGDVDEEHDDRADD